MVWQQKTAHFNLRLKQRPLEGDNLQKPFYNSLFRQTTKAFTWEILYTKR